MCCFEKERRGFSHNGGRYTAFLRFTTPYGGKSAPQERLYGTPSTARTAGSCGRSAAFTTALLSPACPSEPPNLGPKGGNLERRTKTGPAQIAGPHKSVFFAKRGAPILSVGTFPTPPHKIAHRGEERVMDETMRKDPGPDGPGSLRKREEKR